MSDANPSSTDFPLHAAAERGDLERLNQFIASGAVIDAPDSLGRTPLMYAIHGGQTEALRHLLKWGASVASQTKRGRTALWIAARQGNAEAVRLLLSRGADPNQIVQPEPEEPPTPEQKQKMLEMAAQFASLLGNSVDTEKLPIPEAQTPPLPRSSGPANLQAAVLGNNAEVVAALIEAGIDMTPPKSRLELPSEEARKKKIEFGTLHFAAGHSSPEIVRLLIRHGMSIIPTDAADVASSPLLGAVHAGRVDNARVLLEHGADPNVGMMPPLAFAIFKEDIEMAKLLLSFGAATTGHTISSFAKDKPEFAALLNQQRGTEWHHFVQSGNADAVQRALENGANVNARDDKENTALNIAAKCGDIAMAALLLQKGAEVNAGDSSQMTPLHTAINAESLPMVALLLEHGADVNAETKYGMTPLRLTSSEKRSAMRELLLAQGARVDFAVAMLLGDTATVRQRLEEGTPVDLADPSGLTALMAAAMRGDESMLVELHDRWGADVNARDTFGNTALVHALTPAKSNAEGVDMTFSIIDRLLLWGADIEAESNVGTTPLKTAVMSRNPALVTALLDRGANPNNRTPRLERTVLHDLMLFVPLYEEFTTIVQLLIDRGADVNARNKSEETPLIALLQSASLRKDEKDPEAGIARTLSMIDLLVAHGADINAQGSFGKDVLSAAIDTGRVEIVRCVLDHGAKLDDGGMGSLMLVMKQESPEIVALLRERGVAEVKLPGMDSVPKDIFAQLASGKRPFNPVQVMREKMKERQQQPWITPDSRNGES